MAARPRVLIVDDSQFVRRLIAELLRRSGEFEVVGEAADGEEGLQRWRELGPDLLTVDVNMPRLNGLEMIARLRQQSQVPVVVVTALPELFDGLSTTVRQLGVSGVVNKSFSERLYDLRLFENELLTQLRHAAAPSAISPV